MREADKPVTLSASPRPSPSRARCSPRSARPAEGAPLAPISARAVARPSGAAAEAAAQAGAGGARRPSATPTRGAVASTRGGWIGAPSSSAHRSRRGCSRRWRSRWQRPARSMAWVAGSGFEADPRCCRAARPTCCRWLGTGGRRPGCAWRDPQTFFATLDRLGLATPPVPVQTPRGRCDRLAASSTAAAGGGWQVRSGGREALRRAGTGRWLFPAAPGRCRCRPPSSGRRRTRGRAGLSIGSGCGARHGGRASLPFVFCRRLSARSTLEDAGACNRSVEAMRCACSCRPSSACGAWAASTSSPHGRCQVEPCWK